MRKLALAALLAALPFGLFAARLTLRDGTVVYGRFVSGSQQTIVFRDDHGAQRRFDLNQVQNIDFNDVNAPAGRNPYDTYPNDNSARYNNSANRSAEDWAVLPAGTQVSVRTDQDINSSAATEGRTYPRRLPRM